MRFILICNSSETQMAAALKIQPKEPIAKNQCDACHYRRLIFDLVEQRQGAGLGEVYALFRYGSA
jgi:hypothetical protein